MQLDDGKSHFRPMRANAPVKADRNLASTLSIQDRFNITYPPVGLPV